MIDDIPECVFNRPKEIILWFQNITAKYKKDKDVVLIYRDIFNSDDYKPRINIIKNNQLITTEYFKINMETNNE
jgi:hypothetical protein